MSTTVYKIIAILIYTAFIFGCGWHEADIRYAAADDARANAAIIATHDEQVKVTQQAKTDDAAVAAKKKQTSATVKEWRDTRAKTKPTDCPLSADAISILRKSRISAGGSASR